MRISLSERGEKGKSQHLCQHEVSYKKTA